MADNVRNAPDLQEIIARAKDRPPIQEILAHFGYEMSGEWRRDTWRSTWPNMPGQIENLTFLPDFIKTMGADRQYRIIFDYDPAWQMKFQTR